MHWLHTLDIALFGFINLGLVNPFFDWLMPLASGNRFFFPCAFLLAVGLVWKGRVRGVVCLAMLLLAVGVTDGFVCRNLKHALERPRPFAVLPWVHRPGVAQAPPPAPSVPQEARPPGVPDHAPQPTASPASASANLGSMPSSHAANWFAAAMVALIYYRRSLWFMVPLAVLVSFSRVYNGVHYPSDVLAGAILGAGCGAAVVWSLDGLWGWAGRRWFPLWWRRLPSLLLWGWNPCAPSEDEEEAPVPPPRKGLAGPGFSPPHVSLDQHWLRVGYLLIAALLLARLAYIASGTIQLSEDESYQWLWSKHPALSYYSKPPLIAYTQFLGTSLWGDNAFGVRFFSPVVSSLLGLVLLRFFAREVNARAGVVLLLILAAAPMMAVGSVLMTVDSLSVLFWTLAMLEGWRAVQADGSTRHWLWVGLWMGLGFLSKYTALFQWLCWAVFFALWRPARKHLLKPGPWLALALNLLCALPVLIWNSQHQWITVAHVAGDAKAGEPWKPTLKFLGDFLGAEAGLLNPIFFAGLVWTAIVFWRRGRHNPRLVYLFSMGAPLALVYLLYTLHSRVMPNWIAPAVLPLFCLMVIYWDTQWRLGMARVKGWLLAGLGLGLPLVILGHNTDFVRKLAGRPLPVNLDVLHRVRQWSDVAAVIGQARQDLLAQDGKPVFIIAGHYGLAAVLSFYLPEAKAGVPEQPLVFCLTAGKPDNQFCFWPGYGGRKGQNAIFVRELDRDRLEKDRPDQRPTPPQLALQFDSVTDCGVRKVLYQGRYLLRPLQIFECRGLK